MNRFILSVIFTTALSSLFAQSGEIFATEDGAIRGYDPVAFFTEHMPVAGKRGFAWHWKGADWYFSSAKNRDVFKADPEKYAPQYGGFCAFGTAEGHKAPTQPDTWSIVDGKLYFNYNKNVRGEWEKDRTRYIADADKNWPAVKLQE
jgi:YHS domain-containing protein